METNRLKHLYVEELKDLYSAESQLVKALPKMAKAATSEELQTGFTEHLEQTRGHVERLEEIFKALGESPKGKKCKGMEGLIEEGSELMDEDGEPPVLDAGMIAAGQKVEHYEMASYGCARTWAEQLGLTEVAELLSETAFMVTGWATYARAWPLPDPPAVHMARATPPAATAAAVAAAPAMTNFLPLMTVLLGLFALVCLLECCSSQFCSSPP